METASDRRWGDEGYNAWRDGDRDRLNDLVVEATRSGDEVAIYITRAWRGDLGEVQG